MGEMGRNGVWNGFDQNTYLCMQFSNNQWTMQILTITRNSLIGVYRPTAQDRNHPPCPGLSPSIICQQNAPQPCCLIHPTGVLFQIMLLSSQMTQLCVKLKEKQASTRSILLCRTAAMKGDKETSSFKCQIQRKKMKIKDSKVPMSELKKKTKKNRKKSNSKQTH